MDKDTSFEFRLSRKDLDALRCEARKLRATVAGVIRMAVAAFLERDNEKFRSRTDEELEDMRAAIRLQATERAAKRATKRR